VDLAGDGLEGQRFVDAYGYDLLILDLMLPPLSGTQLLQRVAASILRCRHWCSSHAMPPRTR